MPKDIRSYFSIAPKKVPTKSTSDKQNDQNKKKRALVLSSDEELIPDTPPVKKLKKRRVIEESDSDKETKIKVKGKKDKNSKTKLESVNVSDIFGSEPVNRVVSKKKTKPNPEINIHSDEEFEKSLIQLDDELLLNTTKENEIEQKKLIGKQPILKSPKVSPVKDKRNKSNDRKPSHSLEIPSTSSKQHSPSLKEKTPSKPITPRVQSKRKHEEDLNDSNIDPDEERYERKRHTAVLYKKYLNRGGAKNPGSKEIPKGKPGCFNNLVFVVTGVFDSLEREDAESLITDLGGKISKTVTKKVNYVVLGEDAGPAKVAKAESLKMKTINEDELLDLIRRMSGSEIKEVKKEVNNTLKEVKSIKKEVNNTLKEVKSIKKEKVDNTTYVSNTVKKRDIKKEDSPKKVPGNVRNELNGHAEKESAVSFNRESVPKVKSEQNVSDGNSLPWTDKYKPTSVKQIIGQQGPASQCNKLLNWLRNWYKNQNGKSKLTKPSPWAKSDDGAYFKAALLSGQPGVGKTTTATLCCKELGFDIVEFNASDTRSKSLLKQQVSELLSNKSLHGYFNGTEHSTSKKHVLIMDEVDGMAGNEDRGGLQELIALIKDSSVPVICMCNDRNHQKMRTLVNYCYDLKFSKPNLQQIKGAMFTVCYKEGIKVDSDALTEIISGANQDIRQTLNNLSLWSSNSKDINVTTATKEAKSSKKDIKLGPWEVVRKVFSSEDHKTMSIHDKSDLFFHDYSLSPLFVQQNYLIVTPKCPKNEILKRVAAAADSLSRGDLVDKRIRSNNAWSLLPTQAMFSSVLPGEYMSGHVSGQINFPGWLGKNSKRNKILRMSQEVFTHTRTRTSASKLSIRTDYASELLKAIARPMITEGMAGVPETLRILKEYQLLREDIESLQEITSWPGNKDPFSRVDSKVKAALTRSFNKELAPYSYSTSSITKKKGMTGAEPTGIADEENDSIPSDDEQDDSIENDVMIKAKKKATTAVKASTSKPKGSGRGRGRGK